MRLAFYTYSYTDRLKMPIAECHPYIAKSGYTSIDVSGTYGPSEDPASFTDELRNETRMSSETDALRVEAIITHADLTGSLQNPERKPLELIGSTDLAAAVGGDVVTFHMGGPRKDIAPEKLWSLVVEHLQQACDDAMKRHVRIAVDGIWPEWINDTPDALERLFKDVDRMNMGVNFDPCYLTLIDVDPAEFAHRFHDRIWHAHLKDHKGKYPKWTHHIPGEGEMDYVKVFMALKEIRFNDAVAVECFTDMPFKEACDTGFAAMQKAAKSAGTEFESRE
ncbi:MAG: sugar phosphate isomerase/epimerase [Planctomycetota bacterium]|nr:sugar phosphate isomerase/epimerase [Planctomycetota bacterium]